MASPTSTPAVPVKSDITLKIITQRNANPKLTNRLLEVATTAFRDDQTFGWRYPTRHEYPAHHRHMFWRYLGNELLDPTIWVVVAYITDNGIEIPVGYSTWQRRGPGTAEAVKGRDNWLQKSERNLFALHESLNNFLFPNPSAYKPAIDLMAKVFEETENLVKQMPQFENHLHLNILVVDPAYQRRGIGEALVRWGVNKSIKEGLPCALEASRAGKRVYTKCGFEEIQTCDGLHPTPEKPWQEGMHCREEGCQFGVGSFMIFVPPSFHLQ
ncbi:hypothetical protein TWF569_006860 [Orbilia oligospora]|uniref:N-acetyltransferase domain-containing protein n=1 Tax=Orbilia oligospora TaxID=2813651 RepID=A0A7C8JCB4_ORBOL|nr:hypothetical protein TWF102_000778 [Orbilia oligospora]KAF3100954.1 hypothetical protein TWF706_006046 [Orbilia oligospora]KAF3116588.1 hypothetical protein TWF103_008351 [Orbilia oligospora]KAF3135237.1 hypothetical protein TWF703_006151 [Orbilia oligospora]KAF3156279.1 hypothetical protein TWF569_006860 [Orbilia oligospora]